MRRPCGVIISCAGKGRQTRLALSPFLSRSTPCFRSCNVFLVLEVSSLLDFLFLAHLIVTSFISAAPPVDPTAPNFHAVTTGIPDSQLASPLEQSDLEWQCAGGFVTETQVFYAITEDGKAMMFQIIHSSVGCVVQKIDTSQALTFPQCLVPDDPIQLQAL